MAADVKFHLAGGCLVHIQLRIDDGLPVPDRLGQKMAVRIDDTASSAAYGLGQAVDLLLAAESLRIHIAGEIHVAVDKEAVALNGNMADGGLPFLVVVGVGRKVEGDSLLIQGHPGEGHIALPADHAAHRAPGRLGDGKVCLVGVSPDNPFTAGGF